VHELSEEELAENSDDDGSDYEDDVLTMKKQQELEKMLVDIKTEVALAKTRLGQTGKKMLQSLLRDATITKEQQTKLNTLFVKTKDLTMQEMVHFKAVIDAQVECDQVVPAELQLLREKEARVETALEMKMHEAILNRKEKLSRRIALKVVSKSPVKRARK